MGWEAVEEALPNAKLIAWEGCHKIYLAMDEIEEQWFIDRDDYETFTGDFDEMLAKLHEWFEASCGLRLINAVTHNATNPNAGFQQLIEQFELDEYDDEYDDEEEDDEE